MAAKENAMEKWQPSLLAVLLVLTLLAGCGPAPSPTSIPTAVPPTVPEATAVPTAPQATAEPTAPPEAAGKLYVALVWHQHQPFYYKDPTTGLYAKPWVRLHAAKDYVDMAATVEKYPKIHVTFNLTPSLLRQLGDFASGARDVYWAMTEVPAEQLTADQKLFILQRFFDINRKIIARFPRFQELLTLRGTDLSDAGLQATAANWTAQDFRDLQVLFNLGWVDPDWLAQEPLAGLVQKGQGYAEEDKATVLDEHLRLIQEVVPLHKRLQDAGQIEVITTPYAHPILPLLVDTDMAKQARPDIKLPSEKFFYKQDAVAQVQKGVELYQELFGRAPRGMWPAEGSVAQRVVGIFGDAGIQWIASDEGVLAYSLGMPGFTRNAQDTVQEADVLYRPYYVQEGNSPRVAIIFRDQVVSDKIGFVYAGVPGADAAQDLIDRLHAIKDRLQEEGASGPNLVSIILDGENAWEYYDNDGKEFLNSLYQKLSDDPDLLTVTPSEYLNKYPEQNSIKELWAGSWINHDFTTWIGEDEENTGWTYLKRTRDVVQQYVLGNKQADAATMARVMDLVYAAEGSDWFWWFGSDQNSGDDASFDRQFRSTLTEIYTLLNEPVPDWLYVPIVAANPASPTRQMTALVSPTVDGVAGPGEWDAAGYYQAPPGDVAQGAVLDGLYYGLDGKNLSLRVDSRVEWGPLTTAQSDQARSYLGFYLAIPGGAASNPFSRWGGKDTLLGFGATHLLEVVLAPGGQLDSATLYAADGAGGWTSTQPITDVALAGTVLEAAVPWKVLDPGVQAGDRLLLRAVFSQGTVDQASDLTVQPADGPAQIAVPDLGQTTKVLVVSDPAGDDHGPGSYVYPQDAVFHPGNYDLLTFTVGYDDQNIVFQFVMAGPVDNPWGSASGLALQTFDVYIDQDGPGGGGARKLLPGRNAALAEGDGWEYAIWAEGWTPAIYKAGADGNPVQVDAAFAIVTDPAQRKVTIRVPKSVLGDTPADWRYVAVVSGQCGQGPVYGWRVRDVLAKAEQWVFGGAPADTNHTRIIDVAWPQDNTPTQEEFLSSYPASQEKSMDSLGADDFAIIPLLAVK
jgi:alpha-amylase/alpha-mannosidase (GH57 family)